MICAECEFVCVKAVKRVDTAQQRHYFAECHRRSPEWILKDTDECCGWPDVELGDFCGDGTQTRIVISSEIARDFRKPKT